MSSSSLSSTKNDWRPYLLDKDKEDCGYTKLKKLGSGTFGQVNEVYNENEENTHYALKEIKLDTGSQIDMYDLSEWLTEAMILSSSDHPNIIKAKDIFFECDTSINSKEPRIRMLLEKGDGDLWSIIETYSLEDKLKVFYQLAMGLDFLHKHNIIHADLKQENVIMFGKTPKITDFGISAFSYGIKNVRNIVVTEHYRAPEIYREDGYYDEKIDIYSFGVMLFEIYCLEDKYLFYDRDEYAIDRRSIFKNKKKYAEDPDKYLDSKVGDTSSIENYCLIKNLTKSCLQHDSKKRPSASEIMEVIEYILGHDKEIEEFKKVESRWLTSDLEIPKHIDKQLDDYFKITKFDTYLKDSPNFKHNYKRMSKELITISTPTYKNSGKLLYMAYIIYESILTKINKMEELIDKFGDLETVLKLISVYCDKTKFRFFNPAL